MGANHLCPMCMQPVGEDGAFQMDCVPIPHRFHVNCWNYQPEHMKPFCRVCSQQSLGEMELLAVGGLFGFEELEGRVEVFPPVGQQILDRVFVEWDQSRLSYMRRDAYVALMELRSFLGLRLRKLA